MAAVILVSQARPNTKLSSQTSKSYFELQLICVSIHLTAVIPVFICVAGSGLKADCVENLMRLSLDKALAVGNQLEVEAFSEYLRGL